MRYYFWSASILFLIVAIGSWLSREMDLYNLYWYTDVILHTVSGVALGLFWIDMNKKNAVPYFLLLIGTASFAVFGSMVWELWEFAGWRITPSHTQFYIPELGDTLFDVVCGFIGGILTVITYGMGQKLFAGKKKN